MLSGLTCFLSLESYAAPSAWATNFTPIDINNDTNSTLLRDNKEPNTVWVLPPTGGKIQFQNFFASGSVGLCPGLKSTIKASNTLDDRIAKIAEGIGTLETELADAEAELKKATTELGKLEQGDMVGILSLETQIGDRRARNEAIIVELESCTNTCDLLLAEYKDNEAYIKEKQKEYNTLVASNREKVSKYKIAKATKEAAQENFDSIGVRYDKQLARVNDLMTTVSNSFSSKGKLEGGTALVNYESGWDENVSKLESRYPSLDFKAIPTRNARIHANIIGAADKVSYYESLPAVLDYTVNGHNYMPWGERPAEDVVSAGLPSSIAGNFRLSLLGACPMVQKDFFSDVQWNPEVNQNGLPLFGISSTYEYPVAFKFKVTASYNLYKFYEMVKKTGTKGGFFSSKSYSSVTEKKIDKDAFSIDWYVEDPDGIYNEGKRQEITEELKRQLMERVLVTMAQPIYNGASPTPIPGGIPPTPGATVLADGLSKSCGFNIYCQAGSWILRGAAAIWGSSQSESKFQQEWDRTATETWAADYVSYRGASTGFGKK
jgi:hypothetical protein